MLSQISIVNRNRVCYSYKRLAMACIISPYQQFILLANKKTMDDTTMDPNPAPTGDDEGTVPQPEMPEEGAEQA